MLRVERFSRIEHDQRPVDAAGELVGVGRMGVIDEGSSAVRSKAGGESSARRYGGSDLGRRSATDDSVVLAIELQAVPMDGRRLTQVIGDRDLGGFSASHNDRRAHGFLG